MSLSEFDIWLFHLINTGTVNDIFDTLMPLFRNKYFWIPLYVVIAGLIVKAYRKNWLLFLLGAGLTIGLCDSISSKVVKPLVKRARPCHVVNTDLETRNIVHCGGGYSFTSSHATNHFGLSFYLIGLLYGFRKKTWRILLFLWASLVSFAQIYVGVHFPIDILGGALLGGILGTLTVMTMKMISIKLKLG